MSGFLKDQKSTGLGALLLVMALLAGAISLSPLDTERHPASMTFPKVTTTSDVDEILDSYPQYLRFVLEVGKDVDRHTAQKLEATYMQLKQRDPNGTSRFLMGLRFEMMQKLELLGASEDSISTSNPVMRKWIARYMPVWYREADEYLFRWRTEHLAHR